MRDLHAMCIARPNRKYRRNRPSPKGTNFGIPKLKPSLLLICLAAVISVAMLVDKYTGIVGTHSITLAKNTLQSTIASYIAKLGENIELSFKNAKSIILKSAQPYSDAKAAKSATGDEHNVAPKKIHTDPIELETEPSIPAIGTVSSEFGYRTHPITKKDDYHTGLDIAAPLGSEVYSALDGTVVAVDEDKAYGKSVTIQHSGNITTKYAHCKKILVRKGQRVLNGERIALVGNTGSSTGAHLHFEVKVGDYYADPARFLGIAS